MDNKQNFKTTRTSRQLQSNGKDGEAKFRIEQAAELVRPPASKYIGSFASHIYVNDFTREILFVSQDQLLISNEGDGVTEAIASKALDELRLRLMKAYGRNESGRKQ